MRAPRFWRDLQARLGAGVAFVLATLVVVHIVMLAVSTTHAGRAVYDNWLALSWPNLRAGRVWTLVTYGLLHHRADPFHLLFNCLSLVVFGPIYERRLGTKAFFRLFGLSVLFGGLLQAAAWHVLGIDDAVVGASAGVMGLLAAWAWANPGAHLPLFFVLPVPARWVLPIVLAIDALLAWSGQGVAFWAHLGGVAGAWVAVRRLTEPRIVVAHLRGLASWGRKRGGKRRGPFEVLPGGRNDDRSTWN